MGNQIKKISIIFMITLTMVSLVGLLVVSLLTYWRSGVQPKTYVVVDVIRNTKVELPECDAPKITILKDVTTDKIVYKCKKLGTHNEIVTLYE